MIPNNENTDLKEKVPTAPKKQSFFILGGTEVSEKQYNEFKQKTGLPDNAAHEIVEQMLLWYRRRFRLRNTLAVFAYLEIA